MNEDDDNKQEELAHLFFLQKQMQVVNSKKRSDIPNPEGMESRKDMIHAAMYYWNAATVEIAEMQSTIKDREKLLEEYVDVLHFILAMLVYIRYEPKYTLKHYFTSAWGFWRNAEKGMHEAIGEAWFDMCVAWGTIVQEFPYKTWKTYTEEETSMFNKSSIMSPYCDLMLSRFFFIGMSLGFDQGVVYDAYIEKWEENNRRQELGGKYEK